MEGRGSRKNTCNLKIKAAEAYEVGDETEGKRYNKESEEAFDKIRDCPKY